MGEFVESWWVFVSPGS